MNADFRMSGILFAAGLALLLSAAMSGASEPHSGNSNSPRVMANSSTDAGRYLVVVGGCNDCHTANWAESFGSVAAQDWLTGTPVGFRGPWGTTSASNLRLLVQDFQVRACLAIRSQE